MIEGIHARFLSIVNSKSKTFLAFCFSFLAGVAAASLVPFRPYFLFLLPVFFLLGIFWRDKKIRLLVLLFFCFLAGSIRYSLVFPSEPMLTGEHTLTGFVAADPDIRIGDARYIVETSDGKIYLTASLYPQYQYGDVLRMQCRLEKPEPFDGFRYDMYLAKFGVFTLCRDPHIQKIGEGDGNIVMRHILYLKTNISSLISQLWPEPHASFMAGLLYGYRGGLGDVQEDFNRTGVSHIVAISGFNITIIAVVLLSALTFIRIRRQYAFWVVCALIIVFTLLVGASPSVLRAAGMGILALVAKQIGRLSRPVYLLIPTATLMVFLNPLILLWDAGFQLSFAATFGLLSFAPILEPYLKKIGSETMAAIIFTLPLLLYHFGRFSLVAPVVNVLILWFIPWLMLFGVIALLSSLVSPALGLIAAWIPWVGLEYILRVVQWFSALPIASVEIAIPWWGMALFYAFLFFLLRFLKNNKRLI